MSKTVSIKILLRNDTSSNWSTNNPVLSKGEMGIQTDTRKFKFGDGIKSWNELDYGAGSDLPKATSSADGLMSKEDYAKLQGIQSGAEVNVQSDWNASTGDAAILNKPTTLAGYGITDAMTAQAITQAISDAVNNAVSTVFTYKGTKATVQALPSSGNKTGDVWHVIATEGQYVWNGSSWEELGSIIDLTGYLQQVSIAGVTLTPSSYTISVQQLKTNLGLGSAAYVDTEATIQKNSTSTNVPTAAAVAAFLAANATKVESSTTNGNIKVDNQEVTVYTLPNTVLHSTDILLLDCGSSSTNYS